MRAVVLTAVAVASLLGAGPGAAQELRVERTDCKSGVRLIARDVPMSKVLAELSRHLGFQLRFQGDRDPLVNLDLTRPPSQLVAKLLEFESVIYDEIPDPKCPGQQTLAKVWVLPRGEEGPPRPRDLTPMEQYRKAHGLPLEDEPPKAPATKSETP